MNARILIAEDESIIALDLSGILQNLGYEPSGIVSTGATAVEAALADPPDLILMEIYDRLYRSPDYRSVGVKDYLDRLIDGIRLAYSPGSAIRIEKSIEEIPLDSRVLFPVGMIVNELLTNALRNAFPDGRAGLITIGLNRDDKRRIELTVHDDGAGIPDSVNLDSGKGFGLVLVRTLAEQVGGELMLSRSNWTGWTIRFQGNDNASKGSNGPGRGGKAF
ncbi:MAG TPA: ATP-binding protein [Spirochaetota bacterium]|nr:ATP-binding protein [Spirochaetota bacterium]